MSYVQPSLKAYKVPSDFSENQYKFVTINAAGDEIALCGANGRAQGILMNKPTAKEAAEVAIFGAGAKLKLESDVGVGKLITSTAAGLGEVADAAGEFCAAIAMESGVTGDVISVMVIAVTAHASDA